MPYLLDFYLFSLFFLLSLINSRVRNPFHLVLFFNLSLWIVIFIFQFYVYFWPNMKIKLFFFLALFILEFHVSLTVTDTIKEISCIYILLYNFLNNFFSSNEHVRRETCKKNFHLFDKETSLELSDCQDHTDRDCIQPFYHLYIFLLLYFSLQLIITIDNNGWFILDIYYMLITICYSSQ